MTRRWLEALFWVACLVGAAFVLGQFGPHPRSIPQQQETK